MYYDPINMELYLRDGRGGVIKIHCAQACPGMKTDEMVRYLASRFGQKPARKEEERAHPRIVEVDRPPEEMYAEEGASCSLSGG